MDLVRSYQCGPECLSCLERLIRQSIDYSTENLDQRAELLRFGMAELEREYSSSLIPIKFATQILRKFKSMTGTLDPFLEKKIVELEESRKVAESLKEENPNDDFHKALKISALANSLDYFTDVKELFNSLGREFSWGIFHGEEFKELVEKVDGPFLFLADNVGEILLDLPLFKLISSHIPVSHYVVKGGAVQNDATLEDVERSGAMKEFGSVISNGRDMAGLDVDELNGDFRKLFDSATLIVAKGMGHFESLSRIEKKGRTLFLLKAKCNPVAKSLGVKKGDYVALLQ